MAAFSGGFGGGKYLATSAAAAPRPHRSSLGGAGSLVVGARGHGRSTSSLGAGSVPAVPRGGGVRAKHRSAARGPKRYSTAPESVASFGGSSLRVNVVLLLTRVVVVVVAHVCGRAWMRRDRASMPALLVPQGRTALLHSTPSASLLNAGLAHKCHTVRAAARSPRRCQERTVPWMSSTARWRLCSVTLASTMRGVARMLRVPQLLTRRVCRSLATTAPGEQVHSVATLARRLGRPPQAQTLTVAAPAVAGVAAGTAHAAIAVDTSDQDGMAASTPCRRCPHPATLTIREPTAGGVAGPGGASSVAVVHRHLPRRHRASHWMSTLQTSKQRGVPPMPRQLAAVAVKRRLWTTLRPRRRLPLSQKPRSTGGRRSTFAWINERTNAARRSAKSCVGLPSKA